MEKNLLGIITSKGINGVVNINTISTTTSENIICSKCNKQKTLYWSGAPSFASSFFCTCYEPVEKKDLEMLQDEVKILSKKVDKIGDSNEPIKISSHDFLPSTSIFATTIDGELIDVINIKDSFNRLPKDEKLKVVSVLLEFCAMETNKLNQNKQYGRLK